MSATDSNSEFTLRYTNFEALKKDLLTIFVLIWKQKS